MYYNYKQYNSLVSMAIADSNYRFVYVNIGSYGNDCDSAIFKRSDMWKSITAGRRQNQNIYRILVVVMCIISSLGTKLSHYINTYYGRLEDQTSR